MNDKADQKLDEACRDFDEQALRDALAAAGPDGARQVFEEIVANLVAEAAFLEGESHKAEVEPTPDALPPRLEAFHRAQLGARKRREADLEDVATWRAALPSLGGDETFLMTVQQRLIGSPPKAFLRTLADALGASLERVTAYFAEATGPTLQAEYKAAGRPREATESFETAVNAANIPQELKQRWLAAARQV